MAMLRLDLLRLFQAVVAERPLTNFGTIRGQALLIYLAVGRARPHKREGLMALLWPDMPLKSARRRLMEALAGIGQQQTAVAHYEMLRTKLAEELAVEPDPAPMQLAESIRLSKLPGKEMIVENWFSG